MGLEDATQIILYLSKGAQDILVVHVDDIVITGDAEDEISKLKGFLRTEFEIKYLGLLKYFLETEVARSNVELHISKEICHYDSEELLEDKHMHKRLVGKLIYLTIMRSNISYVVSLVSQFIHSPRTDNLTAVYWILKYLNSSPGQGILYKSHGDVKAIAFIDSD